MVRLALVQLGTYAAAVARIAPRLRGGTVGAVVESNADEAQRVARLVGAAVWSTSIEELHEKHDGAFDAWVADSPAGLVVVPHANRPLRLSLDQWSNHPAGWLWGHEHRFLPSVVAVREAVESRKLGAPGLVRIHHWRTLVGENTRYALACQLDIACDLVGERPSIVFAQSHREPPPVAPGEAFIQSLDYVQVHVGFADDRMAVIDCATSLPGGADYYSLSVIASSGAAYADDHHNMQLLYRGKQPQALRTSQGDFALRAALQEFLDAVRDGRAPRCGAAEWQRASRLSAAVDRSLASGESVTIELEAAP